VIPTHEDQSRAHRVPHVSPLRRGDFDFECALVNKTRIERYFSRNFLDFSSTPRANFSFFYTKFF